VRFEQQAGVPLAVIRRQARPSELSRVVPETCGLVWNVVRAQQAKAGRNVAVYLDDIIRVEVGVELLGPLAERDGVVHSATPAGAVAWTTHLGPYGGLGAAHDAVHRWCKANGRAPVGPRWEIYGHWKDEWNSDPSRIRTDVYYLLSGEPPV
jgi:hypothetical protein